MGEDVVLDTPGIYGVSSFNDEETVARDIVLDADVILNVVDAVHLERDLFLTQQVIDTGIPVVVALNMVDEAKAKGVAIDIEELSRQLDVPVVPTVAVRREGFDEVRAALEQARTGRSDARLQERLTALLEHVPTRPEALLVLEGDPYVSERTGHHVDGERDGVYQERRRRVDDVCAAAVTYQGRADFVARLGRALVKPLIGIPVLALTLFAMYEVIGVLVAGKVVGFTEGTVMQGHVEPFLRGAIEQVTGASGPIHDILAGEFGVVTMTVTYIFGLLLPLVIAFYLLMSTLEDSGYLPRIAALSDRLMSAIGLNGRAIIPMILGFGCITMATMTTRILGNERERRIATALMAFAIPCSAQLGVVVALLAAAGGSMIALAYAGIMVLVFGIIGLALDRVLPGSSTDLLIDLPPLRLPRPRNVLTKTYHKTWMFLKEVTLYFVAGALLLSVLQVTGALVAIQGLLTPLTVGWLQLPAAASNAFVMGFVRRDFGAAGLFGLGLSSTQILVALVTITLFVPCIASVLIIMKERGRLFTAGVWFASVALAFFVGGLVARAAGLF
jgi:ferrous iron transport protein B